MKSLLLLILVCAFLCCSNTSPVTHEMQNSEEQREVDSIVDSTLLFLYFKAKDYPDSTFADSAISLTDSMLYVYKESESKHLKYAFQKILFLTTTNRMDSAIDILQKDSCVWWEKMGGPYYKRILEHRILAMKAKVNNDTTQYKENIKEALQLVEKYISENEEEYISFLKTKHQDQRGPFVVIFQGYIYYSYLLYGQEEADKILKTYKDNYQVGEEYINWLKGFLYKTDIMEFSPV